MNIIKELQKKIGVTSIEYGPCRAHGEKGCALCLSFSEFAHDRAMSIPSHTWRALGFEGYPLAHAGVRAMLEGVYQAERIQALASQAPAITDISPSRIEWFDNDHDRTFGRTIIDVCGASVELYLFRFQPTTHVVMRPIDNAIAEKSTTFLARLREAYRTAAYSCGNPADDAKARYVDATPAKIDGIDYVIFATNIHFPVFEMPEDHRLDEPPYSDDDGDEYDPNDPPKLQECGWEHPNAWIRDCDKCRKSHDENKA